MGYFKKRQTLAKIYIWFLKVCWFNYNDDHKIITESKNKYKQISMSLTYCLPHFEWIMALMKNKNETKSFKWINV